MDDRLDLGGDMTDTIGRYIRSPRAMGEQLRDGVNIHGITDGTWSFFDAVMVMADAVGPSDVVVSSWTIGTVDLSKHERYLRYGNFRTLRLLVDYSFEARQPKYCATMRRMFGDESIRIWNSHAKFVIMTGGKFDILYLTSANMNQNPRIESYSVFCDSDLAHEYLAMVDEFFELQQPGACWGRQNYLRGRHDTDTLVQRQIRKAREA